MLAKWEAASDKCKTLDRKVTEFRYDAIFLSPNHPTVRHGSPLYEAPNSGQLQFQSEHGSGWQGMSEAIVWNGEETLVIDGQGWACQKISWKNWKSGKGDSDDALGLLAAFFRGLERPLMNYLPLAVDIHAAENRDRFALSLEDHGEQILIKAVPKKQVDGGFLFRDPGPPRCQDLDDVRSAGCVAEPQRLQGDRVGRFEDQ